MNSQNSKNNAIKAAYGEHWKDVQLIIDENGWFDMAYYEQVPNFDHLWDASDKKNVKIRPKELRGLETNNGWTRIESEEDIPNDDKLYDSGLMSADGKFIQEEKRHAYKTLKWLFQRKLITHYRKVEQPKPPIF